MNISTELEDLTIKEDPIHIWKVEGLPKDVDPPLAPKLCTQNEYMDLLKDFCREYELRYGNTDVATMEETTKYDVATMEETTKYENQ